MLGLGKLLGPGDRKRLPPKEVGPTFDVIPVVERKRLPPKRDDQARRTGSGATSKRLSASFSEELAGTARRGLRRCTR